MELRTKLEMQWNRPFGIAIRSIWCVMLLIMLTACIWSILALASKREGGLSQMIRRTPIVKRYEHPTLRICPEIKLRDDKIDAFLNKIAVPNYYNKEMLRPLFQQLSAHFYNTFNKYTVSELSIVESILDYNNIELSQAIEDLLPTCEELLFRCRWYKQIIHCSELFKMEITGTGPCCVFNGKSLKSENMIRKFNKTSAQWYVHDIGLMHGLLVGINQDQINGIFGTPRYMLEPARSFIDKDFNGTDLVPGVEHIAELVLNQEVLGDTPLEVISTGVRECRKVSEPLTWFTEYSLFLCLKECLIKKTIEICGCVKAKDFCPPGVEICRSDMLACANRITAIHRTLGCKCPRTCDFEGGAFFTKRQSISLMEAAQPLDLFYNGLNLSDITVLRVVVMKYARQIFERRPYFSYFDVFTQAGGLLNLFFGCSILTMLELLMLLKCYVTERWNIDKKFQKAKRRGKKSFQ